MSFSSKLKADYVQLINEELDSIPVNQAEQFNLVAQELQNIITSDLILLVKSFFCPQINLPAPIQEQLNEIRYIYNNPKDYVASVADYPEYKQILKGRITAKISEFRSFTEKEKQNYIQFQNEKHHFSEKISVL